MHWSTIRFLRNTTTVSQQRSVLFCYTAADQSPTVLQHSIVRHICTLQCRACRLIIEWRPVIPPALSRGSKRSLAAILKNRGFPIFSPILCLIFLCIRARYVQNDGHISDITTVTTFQKHFIGCNVLCNIMKECERYIFHQLLRTWDSPREGRWTLLQLAFFNCKLALSSVVLAILWLESLALPQKNHRTCEETQGPKKY